MNETSREQIIETKMRAAGFAAAYNVAEGCEGAGGASGSSGWKGLGLPWSRA